MMTPHAVKIRGLEKRFRNFTLGPLDITVPHGAIYGLIGPNGAGKTTTLDLIFGIGGKDAGSITVLGLDHLRDEVAMMRHVFAELLSAVREGDRTVLLSSHGLTDIERFADHVGMIKNGRLLLEGATSDILDRFRMIDIATSGFADLAGRAGVYVQQRDENRSRVLLDLQHTPPRGWRRRGRISSRIRP